MTTMTRKQATAILRETLSLRSSGATWSEIGYVRKIRASSAAERAKLAKKEAKEAARVAQRFLLEQDIGIT